MPCLGSWVELGKRLFDVVLNKGGLWHLYGHSWEIDRLGLWGGLRELLDYICRRDGVSYLPNAALLQPQQPPPLPAGRSEAPASIADL